MPSKSDIFFFIIIFVIFFLGDFEFSNFHCVLFSLQFSPSDPGKVIAVSADSHIRVLDGVQVICKYKGSHSLFCISHFPFLF